MAKKLVIRGGQKILGTLGSGIGDPILTKDTTTNELGIVPAIDPSTYLSTTLPSAQIFLGNGSNIATAVGLTGAIATTNTGFTSINPNIITNANINTGAGIQYSKLTLTNSIVNNDIATNANITRSKLVAGTPYRVLVNNATGVLSEQVSITPARVLISDIHGLPIDSGVTSTTIGYLDITSSLQTTLNNKLQFSSGITPVAGDLIVYQSGVWNRFARGSSGQYLSSTVSGLQWVTTPSGLPIGGSTFQYLRKNTGTDYDTVWDTLTISKITDITASAGQINVLTTGYYDAVSSVQTQFSSKLNNALANNALFVGNASNQPAQLAAGSNGQVLSIVAGVPQWQTISGTGTVTSIAFSGGTTGLTVTGSPVTTTGTITLTGTLGTANGGTNLTSYTTGDLPYASSSTIISKLAIGTNGYVLTVSGGLPTWQANVASSPLTTKGDLYVYSTTNDRLPIGTNGFILTADSAQTTGVKWALPVTEPFTDSIAFVKNDADNTKLARFDASVITTGTTRVYTLPDFDGTIALLGGADGAALSRVNDTNLVLTLGGSPNTALLAATSLTLSWSGTLAETRGGTNQSAYTLGDMLYASAANTLSILSGNITTTKKFLSQTGDGVNSAAPGWNILVSSDIPNNTANTTGSAATLTTGHTISITGDLAYTSPSFDGSGNVTAAGTLATVASAGTTGSSTAIPVITINAKGLTTGITTSAVIAPAGTLTGGTLASGVTASSLTSVGTIVSGVWNGTAIGDTYISSASTWNAKQSAISFGTGVQTALGVNIGSAGAPILFNGAAGTFASGVGTNLTGTASGLTAGNVTTNANLTGPITSIGNATSIASQTGTGTTFMMSASPSYTGTLSLGTLSYSDTDIGASFQKSVNSYFQTIWQNTNSGAIASTDLIISNDLSTSTTHYLDLGKNSSGFTGSGSFNIANASYIQDVSDDLVIGTLANKTLHFVTNNATTDNLSITGAGIMTFNGSSTAIHKEIFPSLGTTQTDGAGIWLQNSTAAANNAQQYSPYLTLEGQGWGVSSSASQTIKHAIFTLPAQGSSATGGLAVYNSLNGGAYANLITFNRNSSGNLHFNGGLAQMVFSVNNTNSGILTLAATSITISQATNIMGITSTNTLGGFQSASGSTSQYTSTTSSITNGIVNTISAPSGGTGYTAGTKATTGGTGTGLTLSITVSGGIPSTATVINKGTGYSSGDTITISTGSGTATVTISTVDYNGTVSAFLDNASITDTKSIFNYISFQAEPTYNITSTQVGSIYGYRYKGTHTALGSFNQYNLVYENTGSKGGIGTATPSAVWDLRGTSGIPNLKTVGFGTSTNYSIRSFQSDGTTPILNLQDNGNFSIPIAASLSGFGTSSQTSTLESGGSFGAKTSSLSADTTLDSTYFTVRIDASGANRTITLPTASGNTGRIYIILKSDSSANTVTISTTAGGNKVINTQYSGYMVQSNGTSYNVISSF